MVNRIGVHHSKETERLNSIEDFRPSFFLDIDDKIKSRKRLIKIIKNKSDDSVNLISQFLNL